jgi:hypothetical protein
MTKKNFFLDKENLLQALSTSINLYLAFAVLLFIIELIAHLLGGELYSYALIVYASRIGIALVLKYMIMKMRKKISLKIREIFVITFYGIICMFLWFSYPLNIFFSILIIVGNLIGYKAQFKWKL